jgi:hypothetical protein
MWKKYHSHYKVSNDTLIVIEDLLDTPNKKNEYAKSPFTVKHEYNPDDESDGLIEMGRFNFSLISIMVELIPVELC